jgi:hypothetical protein
VAVAFRRVKDVRIDTAAQLRCWNCGCTGFKSKRTMRSKALVGVGALITKKKLKCEACGEYNDTGRAKPYKGPSSARLGKKYGTLVNMHGASVPDRDVQLDDDLEPVRERAAPPTPAPAPTGPALGVPSAPAPPPAPPSLAPPPPGTDAGWLADPSGRFVHRYWDGGRWTEHVHDGASQSIDPP